ncbi:MAG TPA: biotin/lipoyl-containing protein, partial [Ktedonobacterales bacterium]
MPVDVIVPQLGESIVEATVGRWFKRAGDAVAEGEPLVELETDKVNVEVPAPSTGVLERIVKDEGQTVNVGDVIAVVGAVAGVAATVAAASPGPATVTAPANGDAGAATNGRAPAASAGAPDATASATPLARRMAAERGVPLDAVAGSGPGGRVTHHDVTAYLAGQAAPATSAPAPGAPAHPAGVPSLPLVEVPAAAPAPGATVRPVATTPTTPTTPAGTMAAPAPAAREERARLSRRRLTIARRLVEAQHTAAMLTTFNEVDMAAILALRQRRRDPFKERYGVSLGFMSFFTRAVVGALKVHPRLNAEIQ